MTFSGRHVDELISASLTGDLTEAERAELDAHLARCERCRATLAAFTTERRILAALPPADPPRDLAARVRGGIESRQRGVPWWRRPIGLVVLITSGTTVAAAVLAIIVFNNLQRGPVGQASGSPQATLSLAPSFSRAESQAPSIGPSAAPTFLGAGELGYLELSGAPLEASKLSFINDATGASIEAGTVSGPPIAASLSPDGQWLAYITQRGETGANEVWALRLSDGTVTPLGCSLAAPLTERLAWSPESLFLAYTLVAVDLGQASGCASPGGDPGTVDAWAWDASQRERRQLTQTGSAYAASFWPTVSATKGFPLYVTHAASEPLSEFVSLYGVEYDQQQLKAVFLPTLSPDGNRGIFWSGTMASSGSGWQFSRSGMPQLSGDFRSTGPASPWVGTPLFTDLVPYGGEAFAYGKFTWGPDSDLVAFWDGAWTGVPQSVDGTYPSQQGVYVGRVSSGLLSSASRVALTLDPNAWIVDVTFAPDGTSIAVTVGLPSAGIGDPPSAYLKILSLNGGAPRTIGGGADPPPWDGPAVFGR